MPAGADTTAPATVHVVGVREENVTGKPDVLLAVSALLPPAFTGGKSKLIV